MYQSIYTYIHIVYVLLYVIGAIFITVYSIFTFIQNHIKDIIKFLTHFKPQKWYIYSYIPEHMYVCV